MQVKDKVIVVTGGANGIGEAMCRRFVQEKARAVVVADMDGERAEAVAADLACASAQVDVTIEAEIERLVKHTESRYGPIDLFCSNAGMFSSDAPGWTAASCPNAVWQKSWELHVMAHVYAARAVLPGMIGRNKGYLLNTASAAGLLNQIGSAPYSATKHGAISFAESLAITHRDDGIRVSLLCPQAVRTQMLAGAEEGPAAGDGIIEPSAVAETIIQGLAAESFLILPHPEVATYFARKAADYDRWIGGMNRLKQKTLPHMSRFAARGVTT